MGYNTSRSFQIKKGTTRTVFLIGNYAIKIPRFWHKYSGDKWKSFLRGILANIDEHYWWKHSHKKEKLCPVVFKSPLGCILVMVRAESLIDSEYNKAELDKEFFGLPLDNKQINFGKINNKTVLIDYADSRYMCSDCSFNFKNR